MTDSKITLEPKTEHHHLDHKNWIGEAISIHFNEEECELVMYHPQSDSRFTISFDLPNKKYDREFYTERLNYALNRLSQIETIFLGFFDETKARLEYALLKGPRE